MEAKPKHLAPEYGAQFGDESVAAAYVHRPPYPESVFDELVKLLAPGPRHVLELGSGSGDLTVRLAQRVERIDAIEPAAALLARARARADGGPGERGVGDRVRWHALAAEAFVPEPEHDYALAVAAESLHWMDWSWVLPMIARALRPGAVLAIVEVRALVDMPWEAQLRDVVSAHSTNRDFRAYDVVEELTQRGLFRELGRARCADPEFVQTADDYVESFHSRNGFSRERMSAAGAAAFDAAVRDLVLRHFPSGELRGEVVSTLVWGKPMPG